MDAVDFVWCRSHLDKRGDKKEQYDLYSAVPENEPCADPLAIYLISTARLPLSQLGDGSLEDLGPFEAVGAKNLGRRCYSRG